LADFDRNGKLDVAVAGRDPRPTSAALIPGGILAAMAGDGTGAIGAPTWFRSAGAPTSQAMANLNGDHRIDVLVSSEVGVSSLLNASGPTRNAIAAVDGDVDNDNEDDDLKPNPLASVRSPAIA
jgi:hypothetical protein